MMALDSAVCAVRPGLTALREGSFPLSRVPVVPLVSTSFVRACVLWHLRHRIKDVITGPIHERDHPLERVCVAVEFSEDLQQGTGDSRSSTISSVCCCLGTTRPANGTR